MLIYNYDSKTKEYLGHSNAELDPEETKRQGKDVYLIPAYSTEIEPPINKVDYVRVFKNNAWEYEHDYRANYYMVDSSLNVLDITNIGDIPEDYILVTKELGDLIKANPNDYLIDDDMVRKKTEKEKQEEEQERVSHLKCTKRVFVLMLEQLGIDYFEQVQPKIEANRQAKLEWELCVELERSNPLLNLIGAELGITPEQIDNLFKYANGEITQEEFTNE